MKNDPLFWGGAQALTGPWSTNGLLEYIDTNAPPSSAFYRTAAAP